MQEVSHLVITSERGDHQRESGPGEPKPVGRTTSTGPVDLTVELVEQGACTGEAGLEDLVKGT